MIEIRFSYDALKDLENLDPPQMKKIRKIIREKLGTYPEIFGKPLRYSLTGLRSLRVGNWRVEYEIRNELVVVTSIFHRSEGY